ncbi:hypothetical protein BG015_006281 [Linnemannia schmuckeri]|uniref:Uncharacterized protein n=1 Tax=Linnemannia schmuckeri TaxID=64567 RepID=A0A9P5RZY4_9FUNG|nr:hypothetical protein BG015_006281 [Linnemannia schmuckeri]
MLLSKFAFLTVIALVLLATKLTNCLITSLGSNPGNIAYARSKPANEILDASIKADQLTLDDDTWTTFGLVEQPTADEGLIPAYFSTLVKSERYNTKTNIMWGITKDEARLYVPLYFPHPISITGAAGALKLIFDRTSTGRVCHSAETQPVFASGASVPGYSQIGDDARFARQVVDRLATFAKTDNPNPQPGLVGVESRNLDVTSVQ